MTRAAAGIRLGGARSPGRRIATSARDAVAYCSAPARLRRTLAIAVVVGTLLTLLNQGDVILAGAATGATAVKAGVNFLVPFLVSNLGLLSGRGQAQP